MKRGFTLIELLAVIVILAIIAVIAVPIVINIIDDTKNNATLRSADFYLDAAELSIAQATLKNQNVKDGTYNVLPSGDICLSYDSENKCKEELKVEVNGEVPEIGSITILGGKIVSAQLVSNDTIVVKSNEGDLVYATLANTILKEYGGINNIGEIDTITKKHHKIYSSDNFSGSFITFDNTISFGTSYEYNEETNKYSLSGNVVNATISECRNGAKTCGQYFWADQEIYEVVDFLNSGDDHIIINYYEHGNEFIATYQDKEMLYKTQDDLGNSYYFRGTTTNNYVKFGSYKAGTTVNGVTYTEETPIYWRIVRINGDGTIRLVYDGTEKVENGTTHNASIGASTYNYIDNNTKYVGYTYDTSDTDKTQIDSTIKGVLDKWYDDHIKTQYEKYISDQIFCNDREVSNIETETYLPGERLQTKANPTLICKNKNDRYTVSNEKGNGYLSNPVGLLTADEVVFAGGKGHIVSTEHINKLFYLNSGHTYWTATPGSDDGYLAQVFAATANGYVYYIGEETGNSYPTDTYDVRPVINLKADVKFKGNGTIETPYEIVME